MQDIVVRAIDVGYGHVKFTTGKRGSHYITESFPSQSPHAADEDLNSNAFHHRDTWTVPVDGAHYVVGRDVRLAMSSNHETEVLDKRFALSAPYRARLYGAMNYMLPGLHGRTIDHLILGLPLTTFNALAEPLSKQYVGEHVINTRGDKVLVRHCLVYPQPLGSYISYLRQNNLTNETAPMALIIDPGYNTVDWYVCEGMVPNRALSKAVERGMSAALRAIAQSVQRKLPHPASESELVRLIDVAITHNKPLRIFGQDVPLERHLPAAQAVFDQAAQAVRNSVGDGASIEVIVVSGGGAALYAPAIQDKFPAHRIEVVHNPAFANVVGFQTLGEIMALSSQRAQVPSEMSHG